jgi:hypothetical protein
MLDTFRKIAVGRILRRSSETQKTTYLLSSKESEGAFLSGQKFTVWIKHCCAGEFVMGGRQKQHF